jgi:hypothetical protein
MVRSRFIAGFETRKTSRRPAGLKPAAHRSNTTIRGFSLARKLKIYHPDLHFRDGFGMPFLIASDVERTRNNGSERSALAEWVRQTSDKAFVSMPPTLYKISKSADNYQIKSARFRGTTSG